MSENFAYLKISEPEPGIRLLQLDRPDKLNAWNADMRRELAEAVLDLAMSEARVAIIAGNDRAFSAGEDVGGMGDLSTISTRKFRMVARYIHSVFDMIEAMEIPVIAAIEGVAAGGGLELALSCDFRVVGEGARLGLPEANVGLIPGSGGCSRLVRIAGLARAKEIVILEGMMPAPRAAQLGLVTRMADKGRALDEAMEMARELVTKSPLAVGMAKLVLNSANEVDAESGRRFERLGQSVLKKTSDHAEATQAFLEKRRPNWTGS